MGGFGCEELNELTIEDYNDFLMEHQIKFQKNRVENNAEFKRFKKEDINYNWKTIYIGIEERFLISQF